MKHDSKMQIIFGELNCLQCLQSYEIIEYNMSTYLYHTVVCLSAESYTSYWGFLCNIQLPVILIVSTGKYIH